MRIPAGLPFKVTTQNTGGKEKPKGKPPTGTSIPASGGSIQSPISFSFSPTVSGDSNLLYLEDQQKYSMVLQQVLGRSSKLIKEILARLDDAKKEIEEMIEDAKKDVEKHKMKIIAEKLEKIRAKLMLNPDLSPEEAKAVAAELEEIANQLDNSNQFQAPSQNQSGQNVLTASVNKILKEARSKLQEIDLAKA